MKGVLTLNLPDISVIGDGSTIKLHGADRKNSTSNTYSVDVGETDKTFKAHFKSENFKMVQDDYDVSISSQKISHFVNRNRAVKYWIALEPDSEF
jgi:murein L,D-transpeptidase YafK